MFPCCPLLSVRAYLFLLFSFPSLLFFLLLCSCFLASFSTSWSSLLSGSLPLALVASSLHLRGLFVAYAVWSFVFVCSFPGATEAGAQRSPSSSSPLTFHFSLLLINEFPLLFLRYGCMSTFSFLFFYIPSLTAFVCFKISLLL